MSKKRSDEVIKDCPVLKNQSEKSREKIADSFMTLSNNLWSVVIVSIISIPLSAVIGSLFVEKMKNLTFNEFKRNFDAYSMIILLLLITAIILALWFRSKALKIYNTLKH